MTYQARHLDFLRKPRLARVHQYRLVTPWARFVFVTLTLGITLISTLTVALYMAAWNGWTLLALAILLPSLLWIAGGTATSLTGLFFPAAAHPAPHVKWAPATDTAILMLLCREEPWGVAARLTELSRQCTKSGLGRRTELIVLSDTFGADAVRAEEMALRPLIDGGVIRYRRRSDNIGRKPGNIAEWFDREGDAFDQMLILDADSRMSGARIAQMIWHMESRPMLGLLQAGMGLLPAQSRFGQMQRTASRLLGPPFAAGLASWAGATANYWGHNALIRTAAFTHAVHLPQLSGPAPFGGHILSHDFIEAALIRRAGWTVEFDPNSTGSGEDAPQNLAEFHKRNRRWCQGNLQHLRLIGLRGLHPLSRLHIASGIFSFLAAPFWLALVMLMGTGLVTLEGGLPFAVILAVLLLPKLCGLWRFVGPTSTFWRRRVAVRAFAGELILSSLLAPIVMLHHCGAVLSVLAGNDCGWKSQKPARLSLPQGGPEAVVGLALAVMVGALNPDAAAWIAPVAGPMIAAPLIVRWMNGRHPRRHPN